MHYAFPNEDYDSQKSLLNALFENKINVYWHYEMHGKAPKILSPGFRLITINKVHVQSIQRVSR